MAWNRPLKHQKTVIIWMLSNKPAARLMILLPTRPITIRSFAGILSPKNPEISIPKPYVIKLPVTPMLAICLVVLRFWIISTRTAA